MTTRQGDEPEALIQFLCATGHADDMLHNASIAMREAKRAGGGQLALFDPAMRERAARRGGMESELRLALAQQ